MNDSDSEDNEEEEEVKKIQSCDKVIGLKETANKKQR